MDFEISPGQFKTCKKAGILHLLDVREPWEYEASRIEGAKHMPMADIPPALIRNSIPTTTSWFCAITACVP